MPQLNKGGKFVFGLSVIRSDLTTVIEDIDKKRDDKER